MDEILTVEMTNATMTLTQSMMPEPMPRLRVTVAIINLTLDLLWWTMIMHLMTQVSITMASTQIAEGVLAAPQVSTGGTKKIQRRVRRRKNLDPTPETGT